MSQYKEIGKGIQEKRVEEYISEIEEVLEKYRQLEALSEFSTEIQKTMAKYDTKSDKKTMMIKGLRKTDERTKQRESHQKNATAIAIQIANGVNQKQKAIQKPGFHIKIVAAIMRYHDIGHTFLGHSGEWWLSNIGEDYGIGYYVHNALGPRELMYRDKIQDEILQKIKQNHPTVSNKKLERVKNSLWLIMEGINSHNGETPETEYMPNSSKTRKDFEEENLKCYTQKGFDRKIKPATPEACLARLCDKISYAPYDMVDGLREGFITELDDAYIALLTQIGIIRQEIEAANRTGNYDKLAERVQQIWIEDTIANSTTQCIKMSKKQGDLQKQFINLNSKKIVDYVVLKEDHEIYSKSLRRLMHAFGNIVLKEGLLHKLPALWENPEEKQKLVEKYAKTPFGKFIEYTCGSNPEDLAYTKKIVEEATKQGILEEQEKARHMVLTEEPFRINPEFKNRDARIKEYIKYYQTQDLENVSEEQKQQDMLQVFENIQNPRKRNYLYLSMQKRMALEMGRKYLATLDDFEFIQLLVETHLINQEQYQSLTRKYKDFDFRKEQCIQANSIAISKAKEDATERN